MTAVPDPQPVERVLAYCNRRADVQTEAGVRGLVGADVIDTIQMSPWDLAESDLRAILDERKQLVARVAELEGEREGRLAQAYTSGWYDAIEAYRAPGWAEREAGWRKYREALRAESADHGDTVDREPLPSISDGISDAEAEASGTFDLTIAEVHSLKTDRDALAARVAELERALADVDMKFRLSHGGGWCATCRLPMREGRTVVKALAVVCEPCAADLAATAGRLDPTRLAARMAGAADGNAR